MRQITDTKQLMYYEVSHGLEVLYVYGAVDLLPASPSTIKLSGQMIDYWISFATSLDPNDGHGSDRKAPCLQSSQRFALPDL